MKKIFIATILALFFMTVSFAQTFTVDGLGYNVIDTDTNEVEITGGSIGDGNLIIPATVIDSGTTYTVTQIGTQAFKAKGITNVSIPNTVILIAGEAFQDNDLTSVIIPNSVTTINTGAFRLNNLTEITIPASVTLVNNFAFRSNPNLVAVTANNTTPPTLGNQVFTSTSNLITLTVPAGTINAYLNAGWTNFNTINGGPAIDNTFTVDEFPYRVLSREPNQVTLTQNEIGGDIVIPSQVTESESGLVFSVVQISVEAFRNNNVTSVVLPDDLIAIRQGAFRENDITEVIIPGSVTEVDNNAFRGNSNLVQVTSNNTTPPTLGGNVFVNTASIKTLIVPTGTEDAYGTVGWNANFLTTNGGALTNVVTFLEMGFKYEITARSQEVNTVKIIVGSTNAGGLFIEETVERRGITFLVTAIENNAFDGKNITSVIIPQTVVRIGDGAFRGTNIQELVIPDSVTSIGNKAFENNNALTELTLGNSVVSIGNNAFKSNAITNVAIPNSTTSIGVSAFESNNIQNLTLGSGLISIDTNAFKENEIQDLTLGNNLVTIGARAFQDNAIQDLTFNNTLITIGNEAFRGNEITSVNIPNSTTSIGGAAFRENKLTSINLGTTISTIGDGAFRNNPDLVSVISQNNIAPQINNTVFTGTSNLRALTVPDGRITEYINKGWDNFLSINSGELNGDPITFTNDGFTYQVTGRGLNVNTVKITDNTNTGAITIPSQVEEQTIVFLITGIGANAFKENGITSVSIPNSIFEIERDAFFGNSLTEVSIPNSVTDIGINAFRGNDLTEITIPESVINIGGGSFRSNELTSISIGSNVASIGNGAFRENANLVSVISNNTIPPTLGGTNVFLNTSNIRALTVPDGTETAYETAGWDTFLAVNNVLKRTATFTKNQITYTVTERGTTFNIVKIIGNTNQGFLDIASQVEEQSIVFTVTAIANEAFRDDNITAVLIPGTIISIGDNAFRSNALTEVSIPNSVTSIGGAAFRGNSITSINTGTNVTTIGDGAFRINQLESITIGANVTTIGQAAFADNPNALTVISLATTPPSIVQNAPNVVGSFGVVDNRDLTIPSGTTQAYIDAGWIGFNSITEINVNVNVTVAPIVFLQGAATNPIAGEENLMRDSLRLNGLLPTTSPYGDGATVDPTIFNTTGANAIVDWVLVELRTGTDNENTTVVASKAALLQRDGDVVSTLDGTSTVSFTEEEGDYFIAIKHRNHIGVMTAAPDLFISMYSFIVDFTQDPAFAKGENLALTEVNGRFTMIAGDADGSSQILNTDITEALTLAGGAEGYSNADADMNGFVLNSDIQLLVLANSGTVQQFE